MLRFSIHSLRTKLQIFSLLLVAVPGLLYVMIALVSARHALGNTVGHQLAEVAHDTLEELEGTLDQERQTVRSWARQEVMRDVLIGDLDKRVARFLIELRESGAPFLELLCVDREGRVVAATDPAAVGTLLGARDWARAALGGDEFTAGPSGDPPAVQIAAPVRQPDEPSTVIGALAGRYDWRHAAAVADRLRRTLLPHGIVADIVVVDRTGAVILASWRDDLGEQTRAALRQAAGTIAGDVSSRERVGSLTDASTDAVVGWERSSGDEGWLALVMEPTSVALGPVLAMERRMGLALGAVLVGGLAIATLLAGRMTRPLRELTLAIRRVARNGNPPRPIPVRSRDEIGQLAASFNTMTAELERAKQDLVTAAKFAFAGEVAAGIAHEVRTPLGIMRSSAQMLARSAPAEHPECGELVQMIIEEVDRLERVVAGLLELARPRTPLIEPTLLGPVLGRALDFVDAQAREKGITVTRAFADDGVRARCDPDQIYQVALNLIVNALQMLGKGGNIVVRTLAPRPGRVGFEVHDDGPGMPADVRERLFTPFFTRRKGGTGLGLALVQRVVQAHHGTVSVESDVGRGTTFRVELPTAEDAR